MSIISLGAAYALIKSVRSLLTGCRLSVITTLFAFSLSQAAHANIDAAGYTPGELSVTQAGAAAYQIPISVPPGVAGMQPSLGVSYSSQGGNGLMGLGFSLSGLSMIHRCGGTIVQDSANWAVKFDANDNFCLDGERLITVAGTKGTDGAEYRTETDSFQKIISYGQTGVGPTSFKVWSKSGQVSEYGVTTNAKHIDAATGSVMLWKLNKITDATDNYLEIAYSDNATTAESYPLNIQYGANDSAATPHMVEIEFLYTQRSDTSLGYSIGNLHRTNKLLTGILSKVNSVSVTEYQFRYNTPDINNPSKLLGVKQCAGTECLPEITFGWQGNAPSFGNRVSSTICANGQTSNGQCNDHDNYDYIQYPDINGDGLTDVCFRSDHQGINCYLGQGDGTWGTFITTGICANGSSAHGGCDGAQNYKTIQFIDVNRDQKSDIVFKANDGLRTMLSTGSGFVSGSHSTACADNSTAYGTCNGDDNYDYIWYTDLDGDSDVDVCFRSDQGINCFKGDGQGNWGNYISTDVCANNSTNYGGCDGPQNYKSIRFVDVNQDRMADIVFKANDGLRTLLSTGSGFISGQHHTVCADGSTAYGTCNDADNYDYIWTPEINGDAVADVCYRSDQGIKCFLGDGTGGWEDYISTNICANGSSNYGTCNDGDNFQTITFADFNTDGKQDLLYRSDSGLRIFYSNGAGFDLGLTTDICANGSSAYGVCNDSDNHYHVRYRDINADAKPDIVYRGDQGIQAFLQTDYEPRLVSSITDSLGAVTAIEYVGLRDSSVYETDTAATHLADEIRLNRSGGFNLVKSVTKETATAESAVLSYQYGKGRVNTIGRGFLGFETMKVTNQQTGIVTTTSYRQDFPFTGQIAATEQRLSDNTLIGSTTATWADQASHAGAVHFPYVSTNVDEQYELDGTYVSTTTTDNSYDAFGNATQITVTTTDGLASLIKDSVNTYTNDTAQWHLGRLTRATVTHTNAQGSITKTSEFTYNSDGLLSSEIVEPDDANLRLETAYTYDAFGNKLTATTSGVGITARTTTTTYGSDGRFPISVTNALGHSETRTYDSLFGSMLSLTGPNGLTTSWQYDGFGRKIREDRADGTWTTIVRGLCSGDDCPVNAPVGTTLYTTTQVSGEMPVSVYADKLGRVTRKETVGFDGRAVLTDTEYNALGHKTRVTKPYFSGDTVYWTRYEHDILGRATLEASPTESDPEATSGENDVMRIHAGLAVTEIDVNNHETTRIKNLQGKLTQVIDEEYGTTSYVYDATGNLLRSNDGIRILSEMTYDLRGRKITMVDQDMGSWSYSYNVAGELISQTDAKGQTVTMTYDLLGRKVSRTEPEGTTTWTYDTATNGIGKLAQVSGPNGYQQTTSYDSFGGVSSTSTVIASDSYTQQLTYDTYGRVAKKTHPTGYATVNAFNEYGFLKRVREDSSAVDVIAEEAQITTLYATAATHNATADGLDADADALAGRASAQITQAEAIDSNINNLAIGTLLSTAEQAIVQGCANGEDAALYRGLGNLASDAAAARRSQVDALRDPWLILPAMDGLHIPIQLTATAEQLALANTYEAEAVSLESDASYYQTRSQQIDPTVSALSMSALVEQLNDNIDLTQCNNASLYKVVGSLGNKYPPTAAIDNLRQQATQERSQADQLISDAQSRETQLDAQSKVLWQANSVDAQGRSLLSTLGNGLETVRQYDAAQGYLKGILTGDSGSVQFLTYTVDNRGNLTNRSDANQNLSESFTYDGLNRLTSATVAASGALPAVTKTYTYDSVGNITNKSDVGNYTYGTGIQNGAGVHAVTQAGTNSYTYDANGNMTGGAGRVITWASFNKPLSITKGDASVSFEYDADHNRVRSIRTSQFDDGSGGPPTTSTTTTVYLGRGYERITNPSGVIEHKHYIKVAGATVLYTTRSNSVNDTRYLHQDHQGSTDVATDENAQVVERSSFDAFGSRRQVNWQNPIAQIVSQFTRGYTGHEQLDGVGLIHMNGRVYDPELGRFLSADPHVQSLANSQSLNRYSYVLNNPLSYTDPSGYFFKSLFKAVKKLFKNKIVRAVAAIAVGYFTFGAMSNALYGYTIAGSAGVPVFTAAQISAISGAVAGFAGGLVASGGDIRSALISGLTGGMAGYIGTSVAFGKVGSVTAQRVVAHGVVGGIGTELRGGKFIKGFLSAGFTKSVSNNIERLTKGNPVAGGVAAAVVGGTASALGGGKFANGAETAAFGYLFNQMKGKVFDVWNRKNIRGTTILDEPHGKPYQVIKEGEWKYDMDVNVPAPITPQSRLLGLAIDLVQEVVVSRYRYNITTWVQDYKVNEYDSVYDLENGNRTNENIYSDSKRLLFIDPREIPNTSISTREDGICIQGVSC